MRNFIFYFTIVSLFFETQLNAQLYQWNNRVGIGVDYPISKLQVECASDNMWGTMITNSGVINACGLYVNIGQNSTGIPFRVDIGGTNLFQIANDGMSTLYSNANGWGTIVQNTATTTAASGLLVNMVSSSIGGTPFLVRKAGLDLFQIDKDGCSYLYSNANHAWGTTIQNTGTIGAHGLYVNLGAGSDGIPFRVSKNHVPLFQISNNGYVGIGTANPTANLTVKGKIIAEEFEIVNPGIILPDYVFAPDYKLMNLHELEKYITQNRHLPNVPSAAQVQKSGYKQTEMNNALLQKVEEQTLYIIELNKKVQQLEEKLNAMQK